MKIEKKTKVSVPGYKKPVQFGIMTDFAYKLSDGSGRAVPCVCKRGFLFVSAVLTTWGRGGVK